VPEVEVPPDRLKRLDSTSQGRRTELARRFPPPWAARLDIGRDIEPACELPDDLGISNVDPQTLIAARSLVNRHFEQALHDRNPNGDISQIDQIRDLAISVGSIARPNGCRGTASISLMKGNSGDTLHQNSVKVRRWCIRTLSSKLMPRSSSGRLKNEKRNHLYVAAWRLHRFKQCRGKRIRLRAWSISGGLRWTARGRRRQTSLPPLLRQSLSLKVLAGIQNLVYLTNIRILLG
jgi:hypothetical protein